MCLAIPARVIKIEKDWVEVEIGGVNRKTDARLLGDLELGDYILVHAGFGIEKVDKKEAEKAIKLWRDLK